MQHLQNILKLFILYFVLSIPLQIIGLFVVPVGLLFIHKLPADNTGYVNHRMPHLFWSWDNYGNDGTDGDINYRKHYKKIGFWQRYNWLAFRNKVYNFAHLIGVNATIVKLEGYGAKWHDRGFGYWNVYDSRGKRYFEYIIGIPYFRLKQGGYRGLIGSIGYKNFNVDAKELPKHYNYSFSVDLQPYRILN